MLKLQHLMMLHIDDVLWLQLIYLSLGLRILKLFETNFLDT